MKFVFDFFLHQNLKKNSSGVQNKVRNFETHMKYSIIGRD